MKLKKIAPLALSISMLSAGLVAPTVANAEVSASLSLANMYLWRGQNLTPDGPQIAGSLDYSHESGMYAGVWTTNESAGHETDLYVGFGGEAGGFSYDVSYWMYLYPEDDDVSDTFAVDTGDLGDNIVSDLVLSGGMAGLTLTLYLAQETQNATNSPMYMTIDYSVGDVNLLYGMTDTDSSAGNDYSHVTVTYSYNENLTFGVSIASNDSGYSYGTDGYVEEDPLFLVSYSVPLK